MNSEENGYLARHLQSQFYFNYFGSASLAQYRYNYGMNQFLVAHTQNTILNSSVNTFEQANVLSIDTPIKKQHVFKKKRLTKRLSFVNIGIEITREPTKYKFIKKSLNYLDPCRAPPITTLRNHFELQADFKQQMQKPEALSNVDFPVQVHSDETLRKLQIIIKDPEQSNYPFLICKKRKYYRNLKRRYSVQYFQQRAYFISRQIPIPLRLEPKHKNRKSRLKRIAKNPAIRSQSDFQSNYESLISPESSDSNLNHQKSVRIDKSLGHHPKHSEVKKETLYSAKINYVNGKTL